MGLYCNPNITLSMLGGLWRQSNNMDNHYSNDFSFTGKILMDIHEYPLIDKKIKSIKLMTLALNIDENQFKSNHIFYT